MNDYRIKTVRLRKIIPWGQNYWLKFRCSMCSIILGMSAEGKDLSTIDKSERHCTNPHCRSNRILPEEVENA